jgi:plastocyanin
MSEALRSCLRGITMNVTRIWAVAVLGLALVFAAGCSSDVDTDPTPVATFKITPASGTRIPASPTPAAASTAAAPGAEVLISTSGSSLKFDQTEPKAVAGAIRITFDNRDSGIPHNIQFFDGSDSSATSLGATSIATGPIKQELTLNLSPGTYYFQCDVHPTTMKGTLTVQ